MLSLPYAAAATATHMHTCKETTVHAMATLLLSTSCHLTQTVNIALFTSTTRSLEEKKNCIKCMFFFIV